MKTHSKEGKEEEGERELGAEERSTETEIDGMRGTGPITEMQRMSSPRMRSCGKILPKRKVRAVN